MGKIGKPLNAPGYQQVACEREKWEKLKQIDNLINES